jgi:hypothetical protein
MAPSQSCPHTMCGDAERTLHQNLDKGTSFARGLLSLSKRISALVRALEWIRMRSCCIEILRNIKLESSSVPGDLFERRCVSYMRHYHRARGGCDVPVSSLLISVGAWWFFEPIRTRDQCSNPYEEPGIWDWMPGPEDTADVSAENRECSTEHI